MPRKIKRVVLMGTGAEEHVAGPYYHALCGPGTWPKALPGLGFGSVEATYRVLKRQLLSRLDDPVDFICHSQGVLHALMLLSDHPELFAGQVWGISGPIWGTKEADRWAVRFNHLPPSVRRAFPQVIWDLTTNSPVLEKLRANLPEALARSEHPVKLHLVSSLHDGFVRPSRNANFAGEGISNYCLGLFRPRHLPESIKFVQASVRITAGRIGHLTEVLDGNLLSLLRQHLEPPLPASA